MRVYYERGIIVEADGEKLFLDPEISSTPLRYPTLVTHAHSDHTAAISGVPLTYLTKTTFDLFKASTYKNPRNCSIVEFNEPFEIGPFEVEYRNAGHLLGAAQIIVRNGSHSFLYTGDFCPEDLLTVKGADFPSEDIDLTLIDSTYGDKDLSFQNRVQSRQNLFLWVLSVVNEDLIPVLNIGNLGGAQEVISFFNNVASRLPIVVGEKADRINKVFIENGVDLNYVTFEDPEVGSILQDKCMILMPRSYKNLGEVVKRFPSLKGRLKRAIVTGQTAKYGFQAFSYASALSTHAHYDELIQTTRDLNPRLVLTHYGHHKKFARSLERDHSISASSFPDIIEAKAIDLADLDSTGAKLNNGDKGRRRAGKYSSLDDFF